MTASARAKELLLQEMALQRVDDVELARRMGVLVQETRHRITNPNHRTKIDTLQHALRVLGKELVITVVPI